MSILDDVLRYLPPPEWEHTTSSDYDHVRYRLFDVHVGEREYEKEVNVFVNGDQKIDVNRIQRVQNPFQLGRFHIRSEQLKSRGNYQNVVKYYHPLKSCDLDVALEHNMDVRRYNNADSSQCVAKNPNFYKNPGQAFKCLDNCEIILICNVLDNTNASYIYKTTDTEYMPTYVVRVV